MAFSAGNSESAWDGEFGLFQGAVLNGILLAWDGYSSYSHGILIAVFGSMFGRCLEYVCFCSIV